MNPLSFHVAVISFNGEKDIKVCNLLPACNVAAIMLCFNPSYERNGFCNLKRAIIPTAGQVKLSDTVQRIPKLYVARHGHRCARYVNSLDDLDE